MSYKDLTEALINQKNAIHSIGIINKKALDEFHAIIKKLEERIKKLEEEKNRRDYYKEEKECI